MSKRPFRTLQSWYRRNPNVIAYVLILVGVIGAVAWQNHLGEQRKEQICYAEIEDRLLWEDTIDYLGADNPDRVDTQSLPPEIQKLIETSRQRSEKFYKFTRDKIEIPPTICDGTGVTEEQVRQDQIRKGVRENPAVTTTTTGE